MCSNNGGTIINKGTINVNKAWGMYSYGNKASIINYGTINSSNGFAIYALGTNNNVILKSGSATNGDIYLGGNTTVSKLEIEQNATINGSIFLVGPSELYGTVDIKNQTSDEIGAAIYIGSAQSSVNLINSNFYNNISQAHAGGAIYSYGSPFSQLGGEYSGNTAKSIGINYDNNNSQKIVDGSVGGAIMMKGNGNSIIQDVLFTNNSAISLKTENTPGGYAYGGAICVDYSTGHTTGVENYTDLQIKITKSITYYGNTVSSDSIAESFDTYGYHVPTAAAGGFLFLDRGSTVDFNIVNDAVLTIGSSVTSDDTDSIASSIPNTNTTNNSGKHAAITKSGTGELVINSSLNKYYGTVSVDEGQMTVNSSWDIKNEVAVAKGATLALSKFSVVSAAQSGNQNVNGNQIGGKVTVNGTLQTSSSVMFSKALDAEGTVKDAGKATFASSEVKFNSGSTLALTDAKYNLDYAESAAKLYADTTVTMLGDLNNKDEAFENSATIDQLENVGANTILNNVTAETEGKNLQVGGDAPSDGTAYRQQSLGIAALDLGAGNKVTVTGGKTLQLTGNAANLVVTSDSNGYVIDVNNGGTLALGGEFARGGELSGKVTLDAQSSITVSGSEIFSLAAVEGLGRILVGDSSRSGHLKLRTVKNFQGLIFVDPDWTDGDNSVSAASKFVMADVATNDLEAKVVSARNSLTIAGDMSEAAVSAFERIAQLNNLAWKDNVTAAVYAGTQIKLGSTGGILIDGSLTDETQATEVAAGTLTVAKNGMLIVDETIGKAIVDGNVTFNEGSYLGVANAELGSYDLATGAVSGEEYASVVTDNPFISASLEDGKIINSLNTDEGLESIGSAGIQAMTRRADYVLADTIADHTSEELAGTTGPNFWVDVSGEHYRADGFENGAEFKSDAGYGIFGADIALTDKFSAGAAVQYGSGTVRSSVNSLKNEVDSWGLTAYGAYSTGDFKFVGDVAWVKSENDLTSNKKALNQKVDADMYSLGLRAQYRFDAGSFSIVPSLGVRISRLETDAMQLGSIRVKDQEQTLVQVPVSVKVSASEQTAGSWSFVPSLKVAYVPTFGDKEIEAFGHEQEVIDANPVQGELGLAAKNGNLTLNVGITGGAGSEGMSNYGGRIGMTYAF